MLPRKQSQTSERHALRLLRPGLGQLRAAERNQNAKLWFYSILKSYLRVCIKSAPFFVARRGTQTVSALSICVKFATKSHELRQFPELKHLYLIEISGVRSNATFCPVWYSSCFIQRLLRD